MNLLRLFLVAALVLAAAANRDAKAESLTSDPNLKPTIQALVDRTPGAAGVWNVLPDARLEHKLSGLICPAKLPNVELWHLQIYGPPEARGNDVGCDYGRGRARAESKLTIFFVKPAPGETLDSVFAKYQAEVKSRSPDAKAIGPALTVTAADGASTSSPEFRSEEYSLQIDGKPAQSDLIVAIVKGWIVEIRATYLMDQNGVIDLPGPALAWVAITSDVAR